MSDLILALSTLAGIIEVVLRIVPTKKPFSVLACIHELLRKIDEAIPNNVVPEHDKN